MTLDCPACHANLEPRWANGAEIDPCESCGGIWFDSGELGPLALASATRAGLEEPAFVVRRTTLDLAAFKEAVRDCPRCQGPMAKLNYAGDSNVILDRCPDCRGVWCDGAEMTALLQYIKGRDDLRQVGRGVLKHTAEMRNLAELEAVGRRLRQPSVRYLWYFMPWIIPLADDSTVHRLPWVVLGVITANVLILAIPALGMIGQDDLLLGLGLVPSQVLAGQGLLSPVTSLFAHAGFLHVAGNMLYLWIFGDDVEDRLGHASFLALYLGVGILAALPHLALFPNSPAPLIGSSGAVAGILGAYLVLNPGSSLMIFAFGHLIQLPAWLALAIWFMLQTAATVLTLFAGVHGQVAWWAHVSGFAFGALLALAWRRRETSGPP